MMLARCTRPSGATGPEKATPTPITERQATPASLQAARNARRAASAAAAGA